MKQVFASALIGLTLFAGWRGARAPDLLAILDVAFKN